MHSDLKLDFPITAISCDTLSWMLITYRWYHDVPAIIDRVPAYFPSLSFCGHWQFRPPIFRNLIFRPLLFRDWFVFFSLILNFRHNREFFRRHHYPWKVANFYLCSPQEHLPPLVMKFTILIKPSLLIVTIYVVCMPRDIGEDIWRNNLFSIWRIWTGSSTRRI